MQVIDLGAWTPYLEQELRAPYFAALLQRVGAARAAGTVYPPEERTFFALTATPPERALSCARRIQARCRPTAASSAAARSRRSMPFCRRTENSRSIGGCLDI